MRPKGLGWTRWIAIALLALAARGSHAQLISPGKLASVHADLEGIRNCTQCHELGQRGIEPQKCLSCHEPLARRIRADRGLHAKVVRDCASCHGDHQGRGADIARFDERRFRHNDLTDFPLTGQHVGVSCRTCHTPEAITDPFVRRRKRGRLNQTFLGLPGDCASCHSDQNPHTSQISTDCASCHTAADWNRARPFRHASTGFSLVGAHASAQCTSCHGAEGRGAQRFEGLAQTCTGCHQSDSPHGRQFAGQQCSSCHGQDEWRSVPNFRHERTGFSLVGAHGALACSSCHGSGRSATYTSVTASCNACHSDESPHEAQFGSQSCGSCHGSQTWQSAPLFRHERTAFPLTGSHVAAECASCHPTENGTQQFAGTPEACNACHEDAHDGTLGADCATCHASGEWDQLASTFEADRFDHEAQTGFALVGAHVGADCASCHTPGAREGIAPRALETGATFPALAHDTCQSCHTDPHEGTFDAASGDCESCHTQEAFAPTTFDRTSHAERTPFALTGAHIAVPCSACHLPASGESEAAPFARGPLPQFDLAQTCESCHADANPHEDTFADDAGVTACGDCHSTALWDLAEFDHATTGFDLTGAHAVQDCASCHTRETLPDGRVRQQFKGLESTCASCHETPHAGQFDGRTCDSCHDTAAFTVADFDHAATPFPLTGAHAAVPCASCHTSERDARGQTVVRFRPLPTACVDCHGSE